MVHTQPGDAAFAFDVVIDLYFLIDIGLSFRTGFVDSRGELQYKCDPSPHRFISRASSTWGPGRTFVRVLP